jgi:ABC-type amino acid transport system permease subunit
MFSANWLQEHEVLAAIVFITLSVLLTGFFAWLERRFFQKRPH